jgi:hypothetical protein
MDVVDVVDRVVRLLLVGMVVKDGAALSVLDDMKEVAEDAGQSLPPLLLPIEGRSLRIGIVAGRNRPSVCIWLGCGSTQKMPNVPRSASKTNNGRDLPTSEKVSGFQTIADDVQEKA